MIKKVKITLVALLASLFSLQAQELPVPSPYGEVMQRIGLTDVKVEYSRPGVKGREIFGGLEAYGEVWRTGANAATKITLSTDAKVAGETIKAGTYSVFTIPGEDAWQIMLNHDVNASEGSYDESKNALTVEVKPMENKEVETLTFTFSNVKENTADWTFEWADVKWSVPIQVEVEEQAMANIKNKIEEVENAYGVYNSAARYYLEHDKDLEQALKWSKKSVDISAQFWNVHTLSKIQAAMGNYAAAIETATQSARLAKEAEYMPYVKMNEENIAKWRKMK